MPSTRLAQSGSDAAQALRRFGPWALAAVVTLVHLLVAAQSVAPVAVDREVGHLAAASTIAGHGAEWSLCTADGGMGLPLLLAPLWWLPVTPVTIYQIAAFLSAGLGAAVMWPAWLLARRMEAPPGLALAVAALVTLVPARALIDNYVLEDNLAAFLLTGAAVLAWRAVDDGRAPSYLGFGATVGALAAVDPRALPLGVLTIGWLLLRGLVDRGARVAALGGGALIAVLVIVNAVASSAVGDAIGGGDAPTGATTTSLTIGDLASSLLGLGLVHAVSWSLVAVLGALVLAQQVRRAWSDGSLAVLGAPAAWLLGGAAIQVIAATASTTGSMAASPEFALADRLGESLAVPFAVVGAVALWRHATRRRTWTAAAVVGAIAALGVAVLAQQGTGLAWSTTTAPGLAPFAAPGAEDPRTALLIAGAVAIGVTLLLAMSRKQTVLAVAGALVAAAGVTLYADSGRVDPAESEFRAHSPAGNLAASDRALPFAIAADALTCRDSGRLQFELAGRAAMVEGDADWGPVLVVGPAAWPEMEDSGGRRVSLTLWNETAVWATSDYLASIE